MLDEGICLLLNMYGIRQIFQANIERKTITLLIYNETIQSNSLVSFYFIIIHTNIIFYII